MANLPIILSLADDMNRFLPFYEAPAFYNRLPTAGFPASSLIPASKNFPLPIVGKQGFQACMDVGQFKPSELTVKVIDDCVVVEGKHEEREDDHGYITRHFVRRYKLPAGYHPDKVVSTLSSDGVLTVKVPKPSLEDKSNERIVQIQQVGPAHLNVKVDPEVDAIQAS